MRYWWAHDQILRTKRQQGDIKKPPGKKVHQGRSKATHTLKARASLLHTAADLKRRLKIPDVTTSLSAIMISTTEKRPVIMELTVPREEV